MPTRLSNLNFFIPQDRYSSVLRRWCIRGILRCYLRVDPHSLLRDGDSAGSSLMLRGLKWNVYLWSVLAIQSSMAFFPRSVLPRRRRRQHRLRSRKESIAHRADSSNRHSIERCENVDRHRISEVKAIVRENLDSKSIAFSILILCNSAIGRETIGKLNANFCLSSCQIN